jgi:hypothetical protein
MRAEEADPGVLAQSVAAAAGSISGVARLSGLGAVEAATHFAGGKVNGIRFRDGKAWVHVVIDRLPVSPVAEAVRTAATAALAELGQSCEVVVVVEDLELDHLPPPTVTPIRSRKTIRP